MNYLSPAKSGLSARLVLGVCSLQAAIRPGPVELGDLVRWKPASRPRSSPPATTCEDARYLHGAPVLAARIVSANSTAFHFGHLDVVITTSTV